MGLGTPTILVSSGGTSCQEATRDVIGAPLMLKIWLVAGGAAPFDPPHAKGRITSGSDHGTLRSPLFYFKRLPQRSMSE